MKRFHDVRKKALEAWISLTKRKMTDQFGDLNSDDIMGAFECKWQNGYEHGHVNLFCSLGEWACNITDVLKDTRYDHLYLDDEKDAKVLFRFYTRFFLLVSEMLTDFQDIYIQAEQLQEHTKRNALARSFFSKHEPEAYSNAFEFINRVCKHKTQNLHICNNHNRIFFEDAGDAPEGFHYICLGSLMGKTEDAILVPHLHRFTTLIGMSYHLLNEYFNANPEKFLSLCKTYCTETLSSPLPVAPVQDLTAP